MAGTCLATIKSSNHKAAYEAAPKAFKDAAGKLSQPEFYEAYRASRSIIGPSSTSSEKSASVVSAPDNVPGTKAA